MAETKDKQPTEEQTAHLLEAVEMVEKFILGHLGMAHYAGRKNFDRQKVEMWSTVLDVLRASVPASVLKEWDDERREGSE